MCFYKSLVALKKGFSFEMPNSNQQHTIPMLNTFLTFHLEQVVHQGFALIVMIWLECCLTL